ncbi:MAG: hypothetical protein ACPL5F_09650 [Moorellaceae bacterium]
MSRRKSTNLAVVDTALSPEVLEEKRQAIIARAVEAADEVLEALLEEARAGNVQAAKLIMQVAGLLQGGGPVVATQINVPQITISPEELAELERDLRERGII